MYKDVAYMNTIYSDKSGPLKCGHPANTIADTRHGLHNTKVSAFRTGGRLVWSKQYHHPYKLILIVDTLATRVHVDSLVRLIARITKASYSTKSALELLLFLFSSSFHVLLILIPSKVRSLLGFY